MKNKGPPTTVDDYLAAVPEEARRALENLREVIRSVVPKAVEVISYKIPTFRYNEWMLVGFSASKKHCSLHLMSPAVMKTHKDELTHYSTTTATIHFTAAKPLPTALVKKLVKARIVEIKERKKRK